jgi:hypothetical protein
MRENHFDVLRLARVSFLGALALEVVVIFAAGFREAFTVKQIPVHLVALLVGGLGGWLFELFREMTEATAEIMRVADSMQTSMLALTTRITYQDEALQMLTSCPRHNEALSSLLRASMSDNFRNIPLVGTSAYLDFLRKAVEHSDGYEGIQRKPLSWFKETGAGAYLSDLKSRNMKYKKRIFIIDQADEAQMRLDLADETTLRYYWNHTGAVMTYWMAASDFMANFPGENIPKDLALYDRQLLISYDENTRMLSFDILNDNDRLGRLFDAVDQLASHSVGFLHDLTMPVYVSKRSRK